MKSICVGFDLDGVLYDWHRAVYTHLNSTHNLEESYDTFWRNWQSKLSEEDVEYIIRIPMLYEAITPSPSIMKALAELAKDSEIYYITARPDEARLVTERYLNRYSFPFSFNLIFSCDKGVPIRQYDIKHFLDDNPKIVANVGHITNAVLLRKMYYEGQEDGLNSVGSVVEFINNIQGASN